MTIPARFRKLLVSITPTLSDSRIYNLHEQTIRRRLETVFKANRVVRIGSYARGSSIRGASDVDLMLILSRDEVRWGENWKSSTTVLNSIRQQLFLRYPNTEVGRDVQAVVARFRDNQYPIDVVPSFYWQHGGLSNYPIFAIPNGNGGWMLTSAGAHNQFIKKADERSQGKLKQVARLIKFWRHCREPHIPLNSFYLELFLAVEDICVGPQSHAISFNNALAKIANRNCEAIKDPLGISDLIPAANSEDKRRRVQEAVTASAKRAYNAIAAEKSDDPTEAIRLWDLVFNGCFPKSKFINT